MERLIVFKLPHIYVVYVFFPLYWKWKCYSVVSDSLWSSVHGILQARILDWVAISFSRGPSWPRHRSQVSHIAGRFFTIRATWKTQINRVRTTQVLTQRDNSGLAWNWITEDKFKRLQKYGKGYRKSIKHSALIQGRTVEPGGLPSMGSHKVRHDWSDLAAAAAY